MFSDFLKNLDPEEMKNMLQKADLNKVQKKLASLDQQDLAKLVDQVGEEQIRNFLRSDKKKELERALNEYPGIKDKVEKMMRDNGLK